MRRWLGIIVTVCIVGLWIAGELGAGDATVADADRPVAGSGQPAGAGEASRPKPPESRTRPEPKRAEAKSAGPDRPAAARRGEAGRQLTQGPAVREVADVVVLSHGREVHRGRVDLGPSIDRILAGERHPHRNDGAVFRNREGRLPARPRGYYREYVVPTEGIRHAGPQRLVRGDGGDWWYTADHYETFTALHRAREGIP